MKKVVPTFSAIAKKCFGLILDRVFCSGRTGFYRAPGKEMYDKASARAEALSSALEKNRFVLYSPSRKFQQGIGTMHGECLCLKCDPRAARRIEEARTMDKRETSIAALKIIRSGAVILLLVLIGAKALAIGGGPGLPRWLLHVAAHWPWYFIGGIAVVVLCWWQLSKLERPQSELERRNGDRDNSVG